MSALTKSRYEQLFMASLRSSDRIDQDPLRDRFERVPYIQHNRGDSWGLLGFDKKLEEEDIQFVKDNCTVEGKTIDWNIPPGGFSRKSYFPIPLPYST